MVPVFLIVFISYKTGKERRKNFAVLSFLGSSYVFGKFPVSEDGPFSLPQVFDGAFKLYGKEAHGGANGDNIGHRLRQVNGP